MPGTLLPDKEILALWLVPSIRLRSSGSTMNRRNPYISRYISWLEQDSLVVLEASHIRDAFEYIHS